ncbi:MAG: glycosyltransferase [Actinomycetes bacterium]
MMIRVLLVTSESGGAGERVVSCAQSLAVLGWDVRILARAPGRIPSRKLHGVTATDLVVVTPAPQSELAQFAGHWRHPLAYPNRSAVAAASSAAQGRRLSLQAATTRLRRTPVLLKSRVAIWESWDRLRAKQYRAAEKSGVRQVKTPEASMASGVASAFYPRFESFKPDVIHALDWTSARAALGAASRLAATGVRPSVIWDTTREGSDAASALSWRERLAGRRLAAVIDSRAASPGTTSPDELSLLCDQVYRDALGYGPDQKFPIVVDAVLAELGSGRQPAGEDIASAASGLLARADELYVAGEIDLALPHLAKASTILFHRALHFDSAYSPLADYPAGFLRPWHESALVAAASQRHAHVLPGPTAPDRLAIIASKNFNFVSPVERVARELGFTVERIDLATEVIGKWPRTVAELVRARVMAEHTEVPDWGKPLLDSIAAAERVWVEWALAPAVLTSMLPPSDRRTILRLHKYEAWTAFPHLVDWAAIDDLVLVGPHIRDLLLPQLAGFDSSTTTVHLLPVGVDSATLRRPKTAESRRTLGVIGWSAPAKDVVWAIDLLARLRLTDPSFRLMLVGAEPAGDGPVGVQNYHREVLDRCALTDVREAIEFVPFTDDVAGLLTKVGVIVSSSSNEGVHVALLEGAASGAVPLVRNWPMVRAFDGPRRLYPPEWVVDDLDSAVDRILAATADADTFARAGAQASIDSQARFDHDVVDAQLRGLLLGAG